MLVRAGRAAIQIRLRSGVAESRHCLCASRPASSRAALSDRGGGPAAQQEEELWQHKGEAAWFERSRKKVAAMMGRDADSFSEKDVVAALRYLMPTRLTAPDAQPIMKHPSQVFDKRKESAFDAHGRPLESAFYTGFSAYHNLRFQIYEMGRRVEEEGQGEAVMQEKMESGGEGESISEANLEKKGKEEVKRGKEESVLERVSDVPKFWVKKKTMANIMAEEITEEQYKDLVSQLSRLASHPHSSSISVFLDNYRRPLFSHQGRSIQQQQTHGSISNALGRRKASTAVVKLQQGDGQVTVNLLPLHTYFPLIQHQMQVLFPLIATAMLGAVDISVRVTGGGKTGQAGATRLAVSKALLGLPGEHGHVLESAGLLVRDPRAVERKKPGQKKARKKFTWVKR